MKTSGSKLLLHTEGLVVLVIACVVYQRIGGSWGKFALLFLLPDISMLGYFGGNAIGAIAYNAFHTYIGPALVGAVAYWGEQQGILLLCLIWVAHIGFDRLLGYGLKYPSGFKDTHLHRV